MLQIYLEELQREINYLKNASEQLQALNEDLKEGSDLYV